MKRAVIGTAVADAVLVACGVITGSFVARLLEPAGRGALAAALFWPQFLAGIGLLSLNEALTYRIGAQPERAARVTVAAVWLTLALGCVTALGAYLAIPVLLGEARREVWHLARLYLVYMPLSFVALTLLAVDQGHLRFARFNVFRMSVPILYLGGVIALWLGNAVSVGAVVVVNCAASVAASLMRIGVQPGMIWTWPVWTDVKALLRTGTTFHGVTLVVLFAGQVDQILVLALWDDTVLGIYVVALTVASSGLAIVSGTFQKVLFPYLAQSPTQEARVALLARGVRHTTLLLALASSALAAVMPWLLPLLFGAKFEAAIVPAWALLVAFGLGGVKTFVIQALRGFGEGRAGLIGMAIGLLIFVVVAWPFGSVLGLTGLGVAMAVANVTALAYLFGFVRRRYDVAPRQLWGLTGRTFMELWGSAQRPFVARALP
jgi:O-antigen/teichoic acid export membrane protein